MNNNAGVKTSGGISKPIVPVNKNCCGNMIKKKEYLGASKKLSKTRLVYDLGCVKNFLQLYAFVDLLFKSIL